MARGSRKEADAVRRYLEALGTSGARKGRRRTPDGIRKRLETIEAALPAAGTLQQLALVQERIDLNDELAAAESADMAGLEEAFAEVAKAYGEAKGISYTAWREMGVPAAVLKRAGIAQQRRRP